MGRLGEQLYNCAAERTLQLKLNRTPLGLFVMTELWSPLLRCLFPDVAAWWPTAALHVNRSDLRQCASCQTPWMARGICFFIRHQSLSHSSNPPPPLQVSLKYRLLLSGNSKTFLSPLLFRINLGSGDKVQKTKLQPRRPTVCSGQRVQSNTRF